jgi:CelD/BcsL family acetyltransferase involved in cellulose biosynthesis
MGYDRNMHSNLSIGQVSHFYAIEYAIKRGFQQYDLTRGGEDYKKQLGGTARTNLQFRFYRTFLDRWLDCTMVPVLESIRHNPVLRTVYLRLRKEAAGD